MIKFFASHAPKRFLPPAHKMVCNAQTKETKRIELTTQEKRERLATSIEHKLDQALNKHSPLRRYKSQKKAKKLNGKKRVYHELIGHITITHAGIEQNLKATLVCDWGVKKDGIDYIGGKSLVDNFKKKLKEENCLEEWLQEYNTLLVEFRNISKTRNDIVKALYGHNEDTLEIIQIDQLAHNNMLQIMRDNNNDFEAFSKKWLRPIDELELKELLSKLESIAKSLQELRSRIFLEKHKLYLEIFIDQEISFVPQDAYKNPHKYRHLLKPNSK